MFSPAGLSSAEPWNPVVVQFVRERQEQQYNRLADALGLGTAQKAHDEIVNRKMPEDIRKKYGSAPLPTPYEDPYMYAIMTMALSSLERENDALGARPLPHPFLATWASGDVEARTVEEPKTKTPVVFFEQGLFSFFFDIANLMAWASPVISEKELSDDAQLALIQNSYTMPMQASEHFASTLYTYAVRGSPAAPSGHIPEPLHNLDLATLLLAYMERFVMCHELAHIREQEVGEVSPELEYKADGLSASLVTTLAGKFHGSWAVGYWGCELALLALHFLYKAIAVMTFGPEHVTWMSRTHPDPLTRRENLRQIWINPRSPEEGITAARQVCGMMDALLSRLWEISSFVVFLEGYGEGKRASPRWRTTVERFRAEANH